MGFEKKGLKFPSTGPGSRVWVQVPKYGSRFPSTGPLLGIYVGPGSRVRVQVPKYGSRFPSTVMGWPNIGDSYGIKKNFFPKARHKLVIHPLFSCITTETDVSVTLKSKCVLKAAAKA